MPMTVQRICSWVNDNYVSMPAEPIYIQDKPYFVVFAHPSWVPIIRSKVARWKYYQARHIARWEKRYGRPYPFIWEEENPFIWEEEE